MNILEAADKLLTICGSDHDDITECQLLVRCLSEQTVVEKASRRLRTKEDGGFHSGKLQNPPGPDAASRKKAGKEHQGHAANLEETVGKKGSVITGYQYEQNNYSDSQFLKDSLGRKEVQEEETILVTDGAYSGKGKHDLAEGKDTRLVNTDLSGKPVDDILADFVFNGSGTKALGCPAGHGPKSRGYTGCPDKDRCKAKIHKRASPVTASIKAHGRAKQQRFMGTTSSILRRTYHADRMPVRGLIRGRFFFGCKIGALDFKKLFTYRKGLGHYAENPVLA